MPHTLHMHDNGHHATIYAETRDDVLASLAMTLEGVLGYPNGSLRDRGITAFGARCLLLEARLTGRLKRRPFRFTIERA